MKHLKFLMMLVLLTIFSTTNIYAQKKHNSKAKTHKVHKTRATSSSSGDYYNGHKIITGPRGGRYYINSAGNKTYL